MKRLFIIGGYGNFGKLITKRLSLQKDLQIIIGGRSQQKAKQFINTLKPSNKIIFSQIDVQDQNLQNKFAKIKPHTIMNVTGPFQNQNYSIIQKCINMSINYIDIADGRQYVNGISKLNSKAIQKGVFVITGASVVPCLTAAIIDHFKIYFKSVHSIDYAISTAQRTAPGLATTKATFSYLGKPFKTLKNGKYQYVYGWQDLKIRNYSQVGFRMLGNCSIPDLDIFQQRYRQLGLRNISFSAGTELSILNLGVYMMSWLIRLNLLQNQDILKYTTQMMQIFKWFDAFGSKNSVFHMQMQGKDSYNKQKRIICELNAKDGDGPNIACIPCILLGKMIGKQYNEQQLTKKRIKAGAYCCLDMISLEEYMNEIKNLDLKIKDKIIVR